MEWVIYNGQFVPQANAGIALSDPGFAWGATVVDNARTYGGHLFRWPQHQQRFRRDCESCFVPWTITNDDWTKLANDLIQGNSPEFDCHIVTFATPGPTWGMLTKPIPEARNRTWQRDGIALVGIDGVATGSLVGPTVKHRSRLDWWIAEQQAGEHAQTVLFDPFRQTYTETALANLLVVQGGEVVSPPADRILDGITLGVVRELCSANGIPFRFGSVPDFVGLDEAFLAGTSFGIAPVRSFEKRGETPSSILQGEITRRIVTAYQTVVEKTSRGF
jgi:branched-subunit amino acid aminotransferase/4-amino-4-deoxychorismate lyase